MHFSYSQQMCDCQNGGSCDPVSGRCACRAGYTGLNCTDTCSAQFYGPDCRQRCLCANGGRCDAVTGECRCAAGYHGFSCEQGATVTSDDLLLNLTYTANFYRQQRHHVMRVTSVVFSGGEDKVTCRLSLSLCRAEMVHC